MRYKMIISYDGSYFHGFQRQKDYLTVQEILEKAISEIAKETVTVKSSGRTDTGVHALGQVIHFDILNKIPPKNFAKVLNKKLYPHIYIKEAQIVDDLFHARKLAVKKEYHYIVSLNEFNPLEAMYKHFFHNRIDIAKIKEAMTYIVGKHDFKTFNKNKQIKNTVRTIESFELEAKNNELIFKIVGDGFMHNMVRIIIALMLKVGEGKYEPSEVKQMIEGRNRKLVPYVAPANGLYLVKVYYD
ncbi:MAG: tRNA pseudouridine(38-40) synthase TruA [Bacilli bacterium]|jgi:tRNA pseudouridine38-40 synthase|nr:tRNA pseudouridine(38-40) synthase TruA [Bacilli bacterium]HHU24142.1 tRNA pseudouridine(38-40) synthase TruA [Acholeplasmataceae bacterium]